MTPPASSTTADGLVLPRGLDNMLVVLLACAAGLTCAALYYNQPILGLLASELGASPAAIGRIPTLTQIGYTIGILLLAPLGDRYDRRRVILVKLVVLAAGLFAMAMTQSLLQLCAASLAIGIAASVAQDCVPAAATLAPEAKRGKIVGHVMMGLLLGILLSRVVSGTVAAAFGWRSMFIAAALTVLGLAVIMQRRLPAFAPTTREPYLRLLGSLVTLWQRHPALRRAALAQLCLSAAFSAFWSTLAVMLLQPPFGFGSAIAGAFGLAGAVGALAAPLAGHFADRRGPEPVTRAGAVLVIASFAAFATAPHNLGLLIAGTLLFDLGVQAALIAHQSIIYGLEPAARSRLNAVLIGGMFVGMSAGSAIGSLALAHAGWRGVALVGLICGVAALITRLWPARHA
ncbi:MFS transporter [Uliginosibacterium sp. TH139]|jgi:predicted MFS family arabinose efflux permease|uniref:MFS transporter n=1 Tax=Uliginosibacterium sp. TH139 TaxID=2067453 RepID=UPI000C7D86FC|nr:MFS transporter [Uliginosibacterium sp. TH139]PLK50590.1 MFS transporter [Uliginosibacterium sp. TH139]